MVLLAELHGIGGKKTEKKEKQLNEALCSLREKHLALADSCKLIDDNHIIKPKKSSILKTLFQRSKTDITEDDGAAVSQKLIIIRDKSGNSHLFHKEIANAHHPRLGNIPMERWQEMSLNREIVVSKHGKIDSHLTRKTSSPSTSLLNSPANDRTRPLVTTPTKNINLFGLQNVTLHFNIKDILGLGMMLRFVADMNRRHLQWLKSLSPSIMRWIVIAWEGILVSIIVWQAIIIVGWAGQTLTILNRVLFDGIQAIESAGYAVKIVFGGGFRWLFGQ